MEYSNTICTRCGGLKQYKYRLPRACVECGSNSVKWLWSDPKDYMAELNNLNPNDFRTYEDLLVFLRNK